MGTSWRKMKHEAVFRADAPRERRFVECLYGDASQAVGELVPGCEVFGFTKGQFSLMDVITAILNQTGPAKVDISTWTAGKKDIGHAEQFVKTGLITDSRWVVDRSFPARQLGYFRLLVDRFGVENIRMTRTHCKFVLVQNEAWNIVLRSSMNLNKNPRFENFEISDDSAMAQYFVEMVDEIFTQPDVGHEPTTKELDDWFGSASIRGDNVEGRKTGVDSLDNAPFSIEDLI